MSNKRKRYRANKKKTKREEWLNRNNEYGISDSTPFEAVKGIIEKEKRREESNEE